VDSNVNKKETEKLSKYKYLEIDVSRMWKVKTKIVTVINGALGTVKKGFDQNVQLLPGHRSAIEDRNFFHLAKKKNLPHITIMVTIQQRPSDYINILLYNTTTHCSTI
jgi:hypothetical protein